MTTAPSVPVSDEDMLDFNDYPKARAILRNRALEAVTSAFPVSNERYTLRLVKPEIEDKEYYKSWLD